MDIGGFAGGTRDGMPLSRAELELARIIAELHPSASEFHDAGLIFDALPLLREARERIRLGLGVDARAIAGWVEDDPSTARSLARLDPARVERIFAIVRFAIELWSLPEQN